MGAMPSRAKRGLAGVPCAACHGGGRTPRQVISAAGHTVANGATAAPEMITRNRPQGTGRAEHPPYMIVPADMWRALLWHWQQSGEGAIRRPPPGPCRS
jgi:mono/diheme cytochrome c family protein